MNIRFLSISALLFAVGAVTVQTARADDPSFPLEIFETMDAQRIAVFSTLEDILDSPPWHPGEDPAPVGVEEAIELASRFETQKGKLKNVEVGEVKLIPINDRRAGGRWYYLVKSTDRTETESKPHFVAVLMNGDTIPAVVEPDSVR